MVDRPTPVDWRACHDVARQHGRSFFLASRLLPSARRRAILAAYAYCRIADDIVDRAFEAGLGESRRELTAWRDQIHHPTHPVAISFAAARHQYGVPVEPVEHLLQGISSDLAPAEVEDWPELERYCYLVAGTVGLMVAPILGCRDKDALTHAAELGIAMQLTNILRDVAEDAVMGRLYLPRKELAWYGVTGEAVLAGTPEPGFPEFMAYQVGRARVLYASALRGVSALSPSGRATTLAAARLYAGILDEIEARNYDVFSARAVVPGRRKVRIMAGVVGDWARFRPGRPSDTAPSPRPEGWGYPARLVATGMLDATGPHGPSHD